jgi:uncharacterized protein (TIGR02466 family)
MNNVTDLFPIPIYQVDFPDFENIQQPLIDYIGSNFNQSYINEYHGHDHPIKSGALIKLYEKYIFLKEKKTIEDKNLKSVLDFIEEHSKVYWNALGLSEMLEPFVLSAWATAIKKGGFVASHNHNPVPIAGVFYIDANPEMGNLYLENPLDLLLGKSSFKGGATTPLRLNQEIEAKSGKLVLFPGWMKHFTKENPTDHLRMSMAVNVGCQGEVWYTEFS